MPLPPLGRREFLLASAALVTAACGTEADRGTSSDGSSDDGASDTDYQLVAGFPVSEPYVVAGIPQRLPFLIAVAGDAPVDNIDGDVRFEVTTVDGASVVNPSAVSPRDADLPRAYLPYVVTVPEPGNYLARATYQGQDLTTAFSVSSADQVRIPQVGSTAPSVATSTTTDARGVDPICTRDPQCPFHSVNLADALVSPKPTVLLIGTPLYCQTAICGPVLDLLINATTNRDDLDVIHAEVYTNPNQVESITQATPTPIIDAYGLPFEPTIFGVRPGGEVARRLDLIWDTTELDELLAAIS